MRIAKQHLTLSACAAAVAMLLTACGGGDLTTDKTPPTATIAAAMSGNNALFTFTFSEDIGTSFTVEDVAVTGGTAGALTKVDAKNYTLSVTPSGSGAVTVNVAAAKFSDLANNANTVATNATLTPSNTTSIANFDVVGTTYTLTGFGGAEDATVVADPAGGANKVAKVVKSATAELWAGTTLSTGANQSLPIIALSATNKTMTLRVWVPAAGIPVRLKLEDAADGTHSVETEAITTVANAWETLTFNFANQATGTAPLNLAYTFNKASVFFNFGKTGAAGGGGIYYMDDLTFVGAAASSGSGTGSASAGTLSGGIFAGDYLGDLPATARTTLGGSVGFYFDPRLANGTGATYDYAGVSGTAQNPGGVPNFYYGLGLNAPAITNAYFGAYIKAPGNAVVNVSGYTSLSVNVWGPDQQFKAGTFPTLRVILQGPAVAGCGSNSGGSEITATFATNKQGADAVYALPLSGFAIRTACSGETTVAQVLAKIAQFNVLMENTNIQYTSKDPDGVAFTNGLNVGTVKFN